MKARVKATAKRRQTVTVEIVKGELPEKQTGLFELKSKGGDTAMVKIIKAGKKPAKKRKPGKIGRPLKKDSERWDAAVTVRMTETEKEELKEQADEEGLNMAQFLLKCWRERKV